MRRGCPQLTLATRHQYRAGVARGGTHVCLFPLPQQQRHDRDEPHDGDLPHADWRKHSTFSMLLATQPR